MTLFAKLVCRILEERARGDALAVRVEELEQDVADLHGELAADQAARIDGAQGRREVLEA